MERISGKLFKDMLASGMNNLTNHSAEVDSLNVFPVPDGDTGTNMSLTFSSGVNDAIKVEEDHVGKVAKVLSRGLLMGARGNSGVITSQIFRGFFQSVEHLEDMDALQLAQALVNGSRVAYRAVMRPVEGTILTVVREAADYTYAYTVTEEITDCIKVMEKMVLEANESLLRTPELLPVRMMLPHMIVLKQKLKGEKRNLDSVRNLSFIQHQQELSTFLKKISKTN